MKITIRCIGKERDSAVLASCAEYLKRMPWKVKFEELSVSQKSNVDEIKEDEAKSLLAKDYSGCCLIALDESGLEMTSSEFSRFLNTKALNSKEVIFFIGGAAGLAKSLKEKCNAVVSLSKMTMPHKMVRLFLSEQLYRAYTIESGHPYHK